MATLVENALYLSHGEDFTDVTGTATITNNNVTVSTDQSKFGGSSFYFDKNNSSYITVALTATAYTIECWFYPTGANTSGWYPTLVSSATTNSSGGTYMHIDDGSYSIYPVCRSNSTGGWGNNGAYGSTVLTRDIWHHFALCISGSSHYFFLDGNLEQTITQSSPNDHTTWYFGGLRSSSDMMADCYYSGYIDEILITSECKWTTSFTPPTDSYTTQLANPPVITIESQDKSKISSVSGYDRCTVSFTSDQALSYWEARATTTQTPGHGVGLLVESGTLEEGATGYVYVDDEELTNGDLEYRIDIYGQNADGTWSDE